MDIIEGWRFSTADFSVLASGKADAMGNVCFIRSPELRHWWHKMSDELKDADDGPPLHIVGQGSTFEEAVADANRAAAEAKPIVITGKVEI